MKLTTITAFLLLCLVGCETRQASSQFRPYTWDVLDVETGERTGPFLSRETAEGFITDWKAEREEFNEQQLAGSLSEGASASLYRFDREMKVVDSKISRNP